MGGRWEQVHLGGEGGGRLHEAELRRSWMPGLGGAQVRRGAGQRSCSLSPPLGHRLQPSTCSAQNPLTSSVPLATAPHLGARGAQGSFELQGAGLGRLA